VELVSILFTILPSGLLGPDLAALSACSRPVSRDVVVVFICRFNCFCDLYPGG